MKTCKLASIRSSVSRERSFVGDCADSRYAWRFEIIFFKDATDLDALAFWSYTKFTAASR